MYSSSLRSRSSTSSAVNERKPSNVGARRPLLSSPDPWGFELADVGQESLQPTERSQSHTSPATDGQGGGNSWSASNARSMYPTLAPSGPTICAPSPLSTSATCAGGDGCGEDGGNGREAQGTSSIGKSSVPNVVGRPRQSNSGNGRGARCKVQGCHESPSYSLDGRKPAVVCGNHRREKMYRVDRADRICRHEGCGRPAQVSYMSTTGKIHHYCPEHKMPAVIATSRPHCEYDGCFKIPEYGLKDGPLSFCVEHKRTGMFANHNGQLTIATRDGHAFKHQRQPKRSKGGSNGPSAGSIRKLSMSMRGRRGSKVVRKTTGRVSEPEEVVNRQSCLAPGCDVQPSYGPEGVKKSPLFCSMHKGPGMVAVKMNRPCLHQGCDALPHFGASGGRPEYCARHAQKDMVDVTTEIYLRQKESNTRWRRASRAAKRRAAAGYQIRDSAAAKHLHEEETDDESGAESDIEVAVDDGQEERASGQESARANKGEDGRMPISGSRKTEIKSCTAPGSLSPTSASLSTASADTQDASGAGPSTEMTMSQKTGTPAAATSGGRRARAPSMKAREAAGLAEEEGAQLMTKERKAEEAKKRSELRQFKAAAAAAGLGKGVVWEALIPDRATPSGSSSNSGAVAVEGSAAGVQATWRKLSPAEILKQTEREGASEKEKTLRRDGGGKLKVEGRASCGKNDVAATKAVADSIQESAKKRKHEASKGKPTVRKAATVTRLGSFAGTSGPKAAKPGEDDSHGSDEEAENRKQQEHETAAKPAPETAGRGGGEPIAAGSCEFDNCSRKATHGVHDTARYCKTHRIFGMYKIADSG